MEAIGETTTSSLRNTSAQVDRAQEAEEPSGDTNALGCGGSKRYVDGMDWRKDTE